MRLIVSPLTSAAFLPYGEVLEAPDMAGRTYFEDALSNLRPQARPSLSLLVQDKVAALPLRSTVMERHRFSSQSFIPQEAGHWLVVVAPHAAAGGPDMARARAFLAGPHQGVTYSADVWHHPLTILERPARFAVLMWRTRSTGDDETIQVPEFEVAAA